MESQWPRVRRTVQIARGFGDWKQVLDLSLSSTPRPKPHYRGRRIGAAYDEPDSFAANEARLLLSPIAANLLHLAAKLMEHEGAPTMSRESASGSRCSRPPEGRS